jgi:hypothetical protein
MSNAIPDDLKEYTEDEGYGVARYRGGYWPQDWSRERLISLIERIEAAEQERDALREALVIKVANTLMKDAKPSCGGCGKCLDCLRIERNNAKP